MDKTGVTLTTDGAAKTKKPKSRRGLNKSNNLSSTALQSTTSPTTVDPSPAAASKSSTLTSQSASDSTKRHRRQLNRKSVNGEKKTTGVSIDTPSTPTTTLTKSVESNTSKVVLDVGMLCNNLMTTNVASRLLPKHQAYIRSAGMAGISVFEEMMVGLRVVPLAVEVLGGEMLVDVEISKMERCCHFPVGAAITSRCGDPTRPLKPGTLVINQAAMYRYNRSVPYGGWAQMVWTDARFEPAPPSYAAQIKRSQKGLLLTHLAATRITLGDSFEEYSEVPEGILQSLDVSFPIDLSPLRNVTRIGNSFLTNCGSLPEVDLSPFQSVTEIGSYFMFQASRLRSFDAAPLSNVVSIGDSFLAGNHLQALDLSPMTHLIGIPNYFMSSCACLKSLKLPSLAATTSTTSVRVLDAFLQDCCSLLDVDLTPLKGVTSIGSYFMVGCHSLTSIDLAPLSQVVMIGTHWMGGCKGLLDAGVDLSPLGGSLASMGNMFMYDCTSLTHIDLSPLVSLSSLTTFPGGILQKCTGLKTVKFPPRLNFVHTITGGVMEGCCGLVGPVDLTMFKRVTIIKSCFFYGCAAMTSIDLSPLSNVNTIGYGFLAGCGSLKKINFTSLGNVATIGEYFMANCARLTSLNLSPFGQLQVVGEHFASGCEGLQTVDLSPLDALQTIQPHFMSGCTGLTSVTIGPQQRKTVTKVGKGFFANCPKLTPVDLSVFVNAQTNIM